MTPSHESGTREGAGLPAAPSRPAPSAGEDQSPQSKARRMLPPLSSERAPPSQHPRQAPPDTLRRRAGAVISAQLGPRGTRKYVGEKFPLPHGGRMSGERGRKMESNAGKMFLAGCACTIRVPAVLVKNKLGGGRGGAGRAGFLRSDG